MKPEKFRCLARRRLPWREQQGEGEDSHHAVEHLEIEGVTSRGGFGGARGDGTIERSAACRAVAINFRQLSAALGTGLHTLPRLHGTEPVYQAAATDPLKVISETKGEIMGTIGRFEGIGKRK